MIMKSAEKDVVCRVGEDLLVRFKNREEVAKFKATPKQSDFEKNETDVSNSKYLILYSKCTENCMPPCTSSFQLAKKLIAVLRQLHSRYVKRGPVQAPATSSSDQQCSGVATTTQENVQPTSSSQHEHEQPTSSSQRECVQTTGTAEREQMDTDDESTHDELAGFDTATGKVCSFRAACQSFRVESQIL